MLLLAIYAVNTPLDICGYSVCATVSATSSVPGYHPYTNTQNAYNEWRGLNSKADV